MADISRIAEEGRDRLVEAVRPGVKAAKGTIEWVEGQARQIYDVVTGDFDRRHGQTLGQIKKRLRAGESPTNIRNSILKANPVNPNVLIRGGDKNVVLRSRRKFRGEVDET